MYVSKCLAYPTAFDFATLHSPLCYLLYEWKNTIELFENNSLNVQ